MGEGIAFNIIMLATGILCLILFVYSIYKEPRRILCGILLVVALYCTISGGLYLSAPDTYTPDQGYIVGQGSEQLMSISAFLMAISYFAGIGLCVNGVRLIKKEGRSLANTLPIVMGTAGIAWPCLFLLELFLIAFNLDAEGYITNSSVIISIIAPIHTVLSHILLYFPGMLAAILMQSIIYAILPKPKDIDYIITLGAGLSKGLTVSPLLARRLDRAIAAYHNSGDKARFIVSGSQGADEKVSEAFAMRQYLLSMSIPDDQIIMEDRSTNTYQNLKFSKAIMDEQAAEYKSLIVTSNYHVFRAVTLARSIGLNAQGVGGRTALYYLPAAFIREYIAMIFSYKKLAVTYIAACIGYNLALYLV